MAIPDLLKACPLFVELYDKEIEKLVRYCSVYNYEAGEFIVRDQDEGDQIYVLLEGSAMVEKALEHGRIEIVPIQSGDVFGEMALMGQKTRTADIVAKEFSHVLEISYSEIFVLFQKEPKIFGILMLNISRLVSQRLANSNGIIVQLQDQLKSTKGAA